MVERADAQLTFRLSKKVADKLDRIARKRGVQRSDLLRDAAERLVADDEEVQRPFDRVQDLIGSLRSGVEDLGSDHRRHLKRAFSRAR